METTKDQAATDVRRTTQAETARARAAREARAEATSPVKVLAWGLALVMGLGALAPIVQAASARMGDQLLLQSEQSGVAAALRQGAPVGASADYLETLSELALDAEPQDLEAAKAAIARALAADPGRAHGWARLAWIEYAESKAVTPAVLDAFAKSVETCPLCDLDLIRWRFNFVLANWNAFPDPLRRKVFEGADLLRWAGQPSDAEFLAEMRTKANAAGLPYDAYRAAVDTPVKSWDIKG